MSTPDKGTAAAPSGTTTTSFNGNKCYGELKTMDCKGPGVDCQGKSKELEAKTGALRQKAGAFKDKISNETGFHLSWPLKGANYTKEEFDARHAELLQMEQETAALQQEYEALSKTCSSVLGSFNPIVTNLMATQWNLSRGNNGAGDKLFSSGLKYLTPEEKEERSERIVGVLTTVAGAVRPTPSAKTTPKPGTKAGTPHAEEAPKPTAKPEEHPSEGSKTQGKGKPKEQEEGPGGGTSAKQKEEPKPDFNCKNCPAGTPRPVNPIYGSKVLTGEIDLDFTLVGPLPLPWQRTYASDNPNAGWLGQGWTVPLSFRLDIEVNAIVFVDTQGRRTPFSKLSVGEQHYSPYENITLKRHAEDEYEILTKDQIRLQFGQLDPTQPPKEMLLARILDANDNRIELCWRTDGLPSYLIDSTGRKIGFYFKNGRLTQVMHMHGKPDGSGRYQPHQLEQIVQYHYSEEGDLIAVSDASGEIVRTFSYVQHMMVEHTEPGGVVSRYEWDQHTPHGRVLRNTLNTGESWTFIYDDAAGLTTVTDIAGRQTIYHFDAEHNFTGITTPAGDHTERQLGLYGHLTALIDPAGNATCYGYDPQGNLIRVTEPDGAKTEIQYDPRCNKPSVITDAAGRTTRYAYDERGNLIEQIAADGGTTRYQLNAQGLPVTITDARNGVVKLEYDEACRLIRYTDCSGKATRYAYDQRGNLAHVTDAAGWRTEYRYEYINRQDRLVTIKHPSSGEERYAYDKLGRLIAHHDALGNVTRYQLDVAGRPVQRKNALGHTLRYGYDVHGRLITLHNENDISTRFAYDALDRLIAEQGFDGKRIDYRYNRAGHLIESIDSPNTANPLRTRYKRDKTGRLLTKIALKRQEAADHSRFISARTRYAYDDAGQLLRASNPAAKIDLLYHPSGQLFKEVTVTRTGQRSTLEHHYDVLGNRIQTILPDGRKLNLLTYGSGHVHQINLDGAVISDIERNDIHQEIKRSQGALESHYQRDGLGRLLSSHVYQAGQENNPFQAGIRPINNPLAGNLHPRTPNGTRIQRRYEYDRAGQLEQILDGQHGRIQYQYDPLGRLLAATQAKLSETFAFDPAHNLLDPEQAQVANRPKKTSFTQEEWAALVKANIDNPKFNPLQALDEHNNPDTWNDVKANQIKVYEDKRYVYDQYGNTVEKKIGAHTVQHYLWDAEQQLIQATVTRNGTTQTFLYDYDPFGRRIAKRDAFGTTHFTWDGNRILLEKRNDRQRLYVYEPNSFIPLAQVNLHQVVDVPEEDDYIPQVPVEWIGMMGMYPPEWKRRMKMEGLTPAQLWQEEEDRRQAKRQAKAKEREEKRQQAALSIYYYHTDHLGTPRELTDSQGDIRWVASYKAWGNTLQVAVAEADPKTGPIEQAIRFQGQWYDAETGLHYNRFRYYDPDIGKFISQDPIGLVGGNNLYQFASNPIMWVDPLGLCAEAIQAAQEEAARLRKLGGRVPTATCAVRNTATGKIYLGNSGVQPENINAQLGSRMPTVSQEPWPVNNCAEIDAVNKAMKDGSSLTDLEIATVKTKTGDYFPCCKNCSVTFKYSKVVTGKK